MNNSGKSPKKSIGSLILKIALYLLGGLVSFLVLLLAVLLISVRLYTPPNADQYARYWPKDLSYPQADSIALGLVAQMTFDEKLGQMTGDVSGLDMARFGASYLVLGKLIMLGSGENERLHIPPFTFSDGPRGIVVTEATTFPVAMARGASWDRDLELRVADAIGKEARAAGVNYFGGVCINLLRHPAWGRGQETFGEDPWHLGTMGISLINGVQHHNVMACAKHYALNSIEVSRFKVDVTLDERTLREVYLPHFRMAVVNAKAASVMSAYNKVRGEHCGHNRYLLTDILRDDWGFDGFVSSDWMQGLRDGVKGVNAGLDVEMPLQQHYTVEELQAGLDAGKISMARIDEIVRRVVRTKLIWVTATNPQEYPKELLASREHQELALEAAEKGMVLLKNEDDYLPLSTDKVKTLAVIGDLADEENFGDHGSSYTHSPFVITILQGLQEYGGGKFEVVFDDGADMESAKQKAANADAVVFVVGYSHDDEGEYLNLTGQPYTGSWDQNVGGDRPNLFLKPHDQELLRQVLPVNPKAVITLTGGSAIMTNEWDALTPSILMAWYPGMMGGRALARVLFGEANPGGKLPFTVPRKEEDLPYFYPDVDSIHYGYYHGYTLMDKNNIEPAYRFGFGLSYTDFAYDSLVLDKTEISKDDTLNVSVQVTNTGKMAGEEIVQLYVGFKNSAVDRPVKLLRGFEKEAIAPGETKTISIPVMAKDLAWYNPKTGQWVVDAMEYELYVGASSAEGDLMQTYFSIIE